MTLSRHSASMSCCGMRAILRRLSKLWRLPPTSRPSRSLQNYPLGSSRVCYGRSQIGRERVAMFWFRSNIRFGSRLALFALAVQIVLSFGHFHNHDITQASPSLAPTTLASAHGTVSPDMYDPDHKSNGSADFDCPICALIQLAATSVPSVAPALPSPETIGMLRLEAPIALALLSSSHFSFNARGPPTV